jgi:hypothetical protein
VIVLSERLDKPISSAVAIPVGTSFFLPLVVSLDGSELRCTERYPPVVLATWRTIRTKMLGPYVS